MDNGQQISSLMKDLQGVQMLVLVKNYQRFAAIAGKKNFKGLSEAILFSWKQCAVY